MYQLLRNLVLCCLISSSSHALIPKNVSEAKQTKKAIQSLVTDFYLQKTAQQIQKNSFLTQQFSFDVQGRYCEDEPSRESCVSAVCARMPSHRCDDVSELREVALMCANVRDGSCITAVCEKMPSHRCDDMSEVQEVARVCSRSVDGECVKSACGRMPSHRCDDFTEVAEIANACSGLVDGGCVEAVCSRMPSHRCDDASEVIEVIQMCKSPR